jgi:hypothetical protein
MRRLAQDIRRAARTLAKSPLFAAIVITSLGLALALNTTMFALADSVLHPRVPYPNVDRLVIPMFRGGDFKHPVPADVRFQAIRDGVHCCSAIAVLGRSGLGVNSERAEDETPSRFHRTFQRVRSAPFTAGLRRLRHRDEHAGAAIFVSVSSPDDR